MKLFVAMELFSHWYREKRDVLLSFWMPVGFYHRLNLALLRTYLTRGDDLSVLDSFGNLFPDEARRLDDHLLQRMV